MTSVGRPHLFAVVLLALACAALPAAGRAAPSHKTLPIINIALVSDVNTLDPAVSSSFYDRQVMNSIYDKLFDLNAKGHVVPMLATHYTVSKNKLVYTISLRHGVKFQDGTAFNANAVKFNLDRYRSTSSAPRAVELAPVQSVSVVNRYTVRIRLKSAFSPLISILTDRSGMMCSPAAVRKEGDNYALNPVGTGPFKFKERVKGDHITLVRNAHYWRKGYPKARQIVFKIFTDPNAQLVNLQSGQVDFMDSVTSQNIPTVQHSKKLHLVIGPSFSWNGFWLNTKDPVLKNRAVRQAISMLINRKAYNSAINGRTAMPANSPFGPGEFAYGSWDKAPPAQVKAAKVLLSKSHASNVSFSFLTTTAPISIQGAEIIQNMLKAGGITMKIDPENFTTILTQLGNHNFQAAAVGWSGRPDPDQNTYNFFITGGALNYAQYSNATTDRYLNAARHQLNDKKRKADYSRVAKQLQKDVPYVFMNHGKNAFATSAKLKGFTYVPDGIIRTVAMTK
jgi:peptide/nickel transport system substrate-binding protein